MHRFTKENAAEFGRKGALAKWTAAKTAEASAASPDAIDDPDVDPFARALGLACEETLQKLRQAKEPIHRAQLARALRDLRETWHLATGKARPGLTKTDASRHTRREMPRVYPTVYGQNGPSINSNGATS